MKASSLTRVCILWVLLSVLVACGGDSETGQILANNSADFRSEVDSTGVEGVWQLACASVDQLGPNWQLIAKDLELYGTLKAAYHGGQITGTINLFKDSSCVDLYLTSTFVSSYVLGAEITTESGISANEIDISPVSTRMDFADANEADLDTGAAPTSYTIFRVDGDKLYTGKMGLLEVIQHGVGLTADKRPVSLNFDVYLTRE